MSSGPNPILFVAATVLILAGGAGAGYWQYGKVETRQSEADKLRAQVGTREELEMQARSSAEQLQEGLNLITHLERNLATIEYVPTLLRDLQHTGESCNLEIVGVRPIPAPQRQQNNEGEPQVDRRPYQEIDVEVKSKGSFDNVMTFLRRLEDFPKIVGVRRISVSPKIGSDGKTIASLETTMLIRVYVFPTAGKSETKATQAQAQAAGGETS